MIALIALTAIFNSFAILALITDHMLPWVDEYLKPSPEELERMK